MLQYCYIISIPGFYIFGEIILISHLTFTHYLIIHDFQLFILTNYSQLQLHEIVFDGWNDQVFPLLNPLLAIRINEFFRSSHQRCSIKNGALRNFSKFLGKHLCQSLRPQASGLQLY